MEIKDVKEWLNNQPQFEVLERYQSQSIRAVKRIKDDAIFVIGKQRSASYIKFIEFEEDCIHVIMKNEVEDVGTIMGPTEIFRCKIDSIELSEDGSEIIAWEGEMLGVEGRRQAGYHSGSKGGTGLLYSD